MEAIEAYKNTHEVMDSFKSSQDLSDGYYLGLLDFNTTATFPSDKGDRGYLEFVLEQLDKTLVGLPISSVLLMQLEKACDTEARIDERAKFPRDLIGHFNSIGVHFKHVLTVESAAYCVLHNISLLDAAKNTCVFTQREGYEKEIAEITRSFPDLKGKVHALGQIVKTKLPEPGSLYISFDENLHPLRITTQERGAEGFKKYLYEEMRQVTPGEPLPNRFFTHYEIPDISDIRYTQGEDKQRHLIRKAVIGMTKQFVFGPANSVHLTALFYSVLNDIPILSPEARRQSERPDYFGKCNEMRRSAPNLTDKLDVLQGHKEQATPKVHHVPSLPVKHAKKGHKV